MKVYWSAQVLGNLSAIASYCPTCLQSRMLELGLMDNIQYVWRWLIILRSMIDVRCFPAEMPAIMPVVGYLRVSESREVRWAKSDL